MNPTSGGPCQGIRNSIPALKKIGVFNEVVSLDEPKESFLIRDDFKINQLGPTKTSYAYSKKLKNWLRQNLQRFDVVIIHGVWLYNSYGTFSEWNRLKKTGVNVPKIYLMPHGMLDPYFQKAEGRKLKALRNRVFWQLLEKKVINGVDGILFTCEQELILARTTFPDYHPKKELNVGYGIQAPPAPTEVQQQAFLKKCPEAENQSYWLFLSRVHEKKGVDLLIKGYRKLYEKDTQIPILVIAGPGMDTEYGKTLKKLAVGLPVYFTGMLKGDQKWGALYGANWFILPSHQENFGIAVVEALACGTPVAISDQVNIWREIDEGQCGVVFSDTSKGVYNGLKEILGYSEEDTKLKERAYSVFQNFFTVDQAAKQLIQKLNIMS
ncbi:glycosyltransferase involved in cell wall biosynthesis [Leeuwenhoekiella aestuarii]|uniref:Glycosyltransferase involved in cell wall biosynthesis n=2 Tax=Leeuwenhoekiella aestuarii TaxID=2249426 RepID=A0A4Q0NR77_9FLAO|nr:glycosyltransferase involved in cell wall biosynthesis [Leeuwenhoekiella aestuarii]